ncbi:MAG: Xaa-Pro peptidase family protein [Zavarzinella sp.]
MLTKEGCEARRARLWNLLGKSWILPEIVLSDPIHLRYFANFHVEPFHLGADFGGVLILRSNGENILISDTRLPAPTKQCHVDQHISLSWYDGQSPGKGPRRTFLTKEVQKYAPRIDDGLLAPNAGLLYDTITQMRRQKDSDEITLLKKCMKLGEIGHAWALQHVQAGMTELDVYLGIFQAVAQHEGSAQVLYGDFAVSPGSARRGGPPTRQVLQNGDMLILDFSVVHFGYRCDFTNTIVVGGHPTADQMRLYDACTAAMQAGEAELRANAECQRVYDAVAGKLQEYGLQDYFPHHAGHGLGIQHPETPYFVKASSETLLAGDVVTLEPGVYVDGIGGIRIEHNYLITDAGFERLSNHEIKLV